jgi:hypothetical protein
VVENGPHDPGAKSSRLRGASRRAKSR